MGHIKHKIDFYQEENRIKRIKLLYEQEYIEDERAKGISRQIFSQGTISYLSPKQRYIYHLHIDSLLKTKLASCCCCFEVILKREAYKLIEDEIGNEQCCCSSICWEISIEKGYLRG